MPRVRRKQSAERDTIAANHSAASNDLIDFEAGNGETRAKIALREVETLSETETFNPLEFLLFINYHFKFEFDANKRITLYPVFHRYLPIIP